MHHYEVGLLAPSDYAIEFAACWLGPAVMTLAAVVAATLMHSDPHFAGIMKTFGYMFEVALGPRRKRTSVAIKVFFTITGPSILSGLYLSSRYGVMNT